MIIKKVKLPKNKPEDGAKTPQSGNYNKPAMPQSNDADGPRSERRRGDRRRGYRRIDDRNLISRAHEEANAIREMASREGFEYGVEKSEEKVQDLATVLTELLNARDQAMRMAMSEIAQMAVMVAEKIIKQEVSTNPEIVLNVTAETIKEMGKGHQSLVIKVNPSDASIVREHLPELYPYGDAKTSIVVIEDNSVEWGSCMVETNTGMIDARFTTQLAILKKAFEVGI